MARSEPKSRPLFPGGAALHIGDWVCRSCAKDKQALHVRESERHGGWLQATGQPRHPLHMSGIPSLHLA